MRRRREGRRKAKWTIRKQKGGECCPLPIGEPGSGSRSGNEIKGEGKEGS